jgi:putative glutamine amidotransferase
MNPIVGIPACSKFFDDVDQHAAYAVYSRALMEAAGAIPVLLPPLGEKMLGALERLDGLLLSGSDSNVAPHHYGCAEDATPDQHDAARDTTALPLIREAVRRGLPILAICRGMQELNVALGGTLHQRVHQMPGRFDHREPEGPTETQFALAHDVAVSGFLCELFGSGRTRVNSLHGQAIDQPAPPLAVEALAEDGTIEAVRGAECPGFVLGVQWHPEWHVARDTPSRAVFAAFGEACRAYAGGRR